MSDDARVFNRWTKCLNLNDFLQSLCNCILIKYIKVKNSFIFQIETSDFKGGSRLLTSCVPECKECKDCLILCCYFKYNSSSNCHSLS